VVEVIKSFLSTSETLKGLLLTMSGLFQALRESLLLQAKSGLIDSNMTLFSSGQAADGGASASG
jgi:hypothetical protein